jgi:CpXC protein
VSTFSIQSVQCRCGFNFQGEVFDSLHVSRRPDIREQILAGTFHGFPCSQCGKRVTVETRLAYTDFPRKQWFTMYPRIDIRHRDELVDFAKRSFQATMVERAAELARSWAPEMTQRVIFGLASLREKLIVFDAGLDDRTIECLKLQMYRQTGLVLHPDTYLHVTAVEDDTIVMEYGPPGERPNPLPVSRELYVALELRRDTLEAELPWLYEDIVVDHRCAFAPKAPLMPAQGGLT